MPPRQPISPIVNNVHGSNSYRPFHASSFKSMSQSVTFTLVQALENTASKANCTASYVIKSTENYLQLVAKDIVSFQRILSKKHSLL